jgi:hypothetical protein
MPLRVILTFVVRQLMRRQPYLITSLPYGMTILMLIMDLLVEFQVMDLIFNSKVDQVHLKLMMMKPIPLTRISFIVLVDLHTIRDSAIKFFHPLIIQIPLKLTLHLLSIVKITDQFLDLQILFLVDQIMINTYIQTSLDSLINVELIRDMMMLVG